MRERAIHVTIDEAVQHGDVAQIQQLALILLAVDGREPPSLGGVVVSEPKSMLELRCVPGARRPGVVGRYGEAWKVRIAAASEKGRANAELIALLADLLDVSKSAIEITRGHTSRNKHVRVHGRAQCDVEERLLIRLAASQ